MQIEYDKSKYTLLISPRKFQQRKIITQNTIQYPDFEEDVTGSVHVLYLCVVQSETVVTKTYLDCANMILKYLDNLHNNATAFFHC